MSPVDSTLCSRRVFLSRTANRPTTPATPLRPEPGLSTAAKDAIGSTSLVRLKLIFESPCGHRKDGDSFAKPVTGRRVSGRRPRHRIDEDRLTCDVDSDSGNSTERRDGTGQHQRSGTNSCTQSNNRYAQSSHSAIRVEIRTIRISESRLQTVASARGGHPDHRGRRGNPCGPLACPDRSRSCGAVATWWSTRTAIRDRRST